MMENVNGLTADQNLGEQIPAVFADHLPNEAAFAEEAYALYAADTPEQRNAGF